MRQLGLALALLALCCSGGCVGVQVKVGDLSFPLEAVKELKVLLGLDDHLNPHLASTSTAAVCDHPVLPQVFVPVCRERGAGAVFSRLVTIITPTDPCEICANPSCYGCLT